MFTVELKNVKRKQIIIFAAISIIIFSLFLPSHIETRLSDIVSMPVPGKLSFSVNLVDRLYTQLLSLEYFLENPIWGIGYHGINSLQEWSSRGLFLVPHSQYVKILAEMGIFSFIAFTLMLGYLLVFIHKHLNISRKLNSNDTGIWLGFFSLFNYCVCIRRVFWWI